MKTTTTPTTSIQIKTNNLLIKPLFLNRNSLFGRNNINIRYPKRSIAMDVRDCERTIRRKETVNISQYFIVRTSLKLNNAQKKNPTFKNAK